MSSSQSPDQSEASRDAPPIRQPRVRGSLLALARSPAQHPCLFAGLCLAAFAFWVVLFPLTNADIWWHLAAGRHMVEHGGFIYEDPFSYLTEGVPWTNVHWLFQLVAYAVHTAAGVPGLIAAKGFIFAGACVLLLWACCRGETAALALALLAAIACSIRFLVLVRPIVATLLYLAAFLAVLEHYRRTRRARLLWVLPAIQVLWTNTQGLYPLGPATFLAYLAGEALLRVLAGTETRLIAFERPLGRAELRPLAYSFLATCAACLISPYGPRALLLPWRLLARIEPALSELYSWNVSENVPTWALMREDPSRVAHVTWLSVLALLSFVLARTRVHPGRLLAFAAFLYLGLRAERNVSVYLCVAGPLAMLNVNAALDELASSGRLSRFRTWLPRLGAALAAAVLLAAGIAVLRSKARDPSTFALAPFRYPVEAARLLASDAFEGNLFNSVRYGGYLIWDLHPPRKVFIDGRLVLRTPEQFREYLRVLDNPELFETWQRRWNITRAVLPTAVFMRYMPLVRTLYRDPRWALVYADGASVLFARGPRSGPAVDLGSRRDVEGILAEIERRWRGNSYVREAARLDLAALLIYLDCLDGAQQILADADSLRGRLLLAQCRYLQGRAGEAQRIAEQILRENPHEALCLDLLGRLHLDRGDTRRALECFRAVLDRDPYDPYARRAIDEIEKRLRE